MVDVQRVQEGPSIELLNTKVDDDKLYLLDVKDFATLVEGVEVFRENAEYPTVSHRSPMIISYEYNLKGRFIEVIVSKPLVKESSRWEECVGERGQTHLNIFQDIPVRNVFFQLTRL